MDKAIKDAFTRNLIWIITCLAGIGTVLATVRYQGQDLEMQKKLVSVDHDKIANCELVESRLHDADEMAIIKLDSISSDIKDLKNTLTALDTKMNDRMSKMGDRTQAQFDEIKKILYKPVVGDNTTRFDMIDLSTGNLVKK